MCPLKDRTCHLELKYSNYKDRKQNTLLPDETENPKMIIKLATCLLAAAVLTACESNQSAGRQTLEQRMMARYASSANASTSANANEPAPPAEGPEDVPGEGPADVMRNPGVVPTPLLRDNATGDL